MKNRVLVILFVFSFSGIFAQVEDAWVYFKDKPNEASYFATPLNMLTQRSLDRRERYSIPLDSKDVPIEASYVSKINETPVSILARSKWLNALHIQGTKAEIDALVNLEIDGNYFVASIEFANRSLNGSKPSKIKNKIRPKKKNVSTLTNFDYGNAENQILMLGADTLHLNNFTGGGMQIAVIDAGFPKVDSLLAFKRLRDNGQILGGYDFVNRSTDYDTGGSSHGQIVLSIIGGYLKNGVDGATSNYVGTAPDAKFYLFISENASVEVKLEESLWVEAAERADSLGVDVINTSLGYSVFFDNPNHNYDYNDMDGQTAFITRGAEIAFSRGMILVNSAGNEGNDPDWPYINAPADGPSVLTIGAVKSDRNIATFSSYGPTSDGRIKPDVCAQGQATAIINTSSNVSSGNGTSYSSPVMAGVIACLWQAFPNKTNAEIIQLVKESGHLYDISTAPIPTIDYQMGYGIPDFSSIFASLNEEELEIDNDGILFYPNPSSNRIHIKFPKDINTLKVSIFSISGTMIFKNEIERTNPDIDISSLSTGLYLLKVESGKEIKEFKLLKN